MRDLLAPNHRNVFLCATFSHMAYFTNNVVKQLLEENYIECIPSRIEDIKNLTDDNERWRLIDHKQIQTEVFINQEKKDEKRDAKSTRKLPEPVERLLTPSIKISKKMSNNSRESSDSISYYLRTTLMEWFNPLYIQCLVFSKPLTKELIIAFKGCDAKECNTITIYVDHSPLSHVNHLVKTHIPKSLIEYVKKCKIDHPDWKIFLTGHSLGGYIAAYCALFNSFSSEAVYAFDAPSLDIPYEHLSNSFNIIHPKMYNFVNEPNLINCMGYDDWYDYLYVPVQNDYASNLAKKSNNIFFCGCSQYFSVGKNRR